MSMSKLFVGAAWAMAGALGAGTAQAGTADLQWSIVIGTPVYAQPAPRYRLPAAGHPRVAYLQPTRWDRDGDGIPNHRDRLYNPRWDRDGDGIPNRHDRHPGRGWPAR